MSIKVDSSLWPDIDGIADKNEISREDCGSDGIAPGACGLYAAIGAVDLNAALKAAMTMQERGTFGAGVMLRGIYPKRTQYYAFHVLYRTRKVAKELEPIFTEQRAGLRQFGEMEPLVTPEAYRKYRLPDMRRYFMTSPTRDEMQTRAHTEDEDSFIRATVEEFNRKYMGDARIFSSGKNMGVFPTALKLKDTIEVFDLMQYAQKPINAILIHMRWPTSIVDSGVWWGIHPISILNSSIVHNGDLSSSPSNRQGLVSADVDRSVGTDSEAILLELDNLVRKRNLDYRQIEWVMCQKFPKELDRLDPEEREAYLKLVADPVLARFKMSGPSSFIGIIDDTVFVGRDRDGLRQLWMGESDDGRLAIWGSEEKVIYQSAWLAERKFSSVSCDPGRIMVYKIDEEGCISHKYGQWIEG